MVSWSRHGTVSIRSVHLGALPSLASENMSLSVLFFHLKISLIWLICFCFFFVSARLGRFQTRCCSMALLQPLGTSGMLSLHIVCDGLPRFQISYVRSLRDTKRAKRISVPGPRVPSQAGTSCTSKRLAILPQTLFETESELTWNDPEKLRHGRQLCSQRAKLFVLSVLCRKATD